MRFKLKLLSFFFLFGFTLSYGQYQQLLHKPYREKVEDIHQLYKNTINKGREDSLYICNYTQQIKDYALINDDQELSLEADLLYAYSRWFLYGQEKPDFLDDLLLMVEKGEKEKVTHIKIRAANVLANHYWQVKNYEKSFEWLLYSSKILETTTSENFPNMAEHLNFIGRCYYYFKDYENAMVYYKKSSEIIKTNFNAKAVLEAQNTLGLCYQKLGQLSLAKKHFTKVINDTSKYKDLIWQGIASGNLGYNYYLEESYNKAIPLFEKDIQNALQIGELGLAAGSAIPLADIYLKNGKLESAKQKIAEARSYIRQSQQKDRLRKLYPLMSKWHAANFEIDSSSIYLDSTIMAINAYHQKYNTIKLLRANQRVDAIDRELEIEKLHTENRLKISQRNYIILSISLLLLGSLLAYWFRNQSLLRKQEIKLLKIEKTERELKLSKNQLQNLKLKIQNGQKTIESLQKEIKTNDNQNIIGELKSKIIITNEDWDKYQILFTEAYPNFITSLKNTFENLTPSELRCLCLEKLKLSNKEMALVLGVSSNSVMVTKHRIRKKLNLKSQQELQKLVKEMK